MIKISESATNALKDGGTKKFLKITFPSSDDRPLYNEDIVSESFKFTESICSQDRLKFGLCEASVVEFQAINIPNITGKEICVSINVHYMDKPEYKTINSEGNTININEMFFLNMNNVSYEFYNCEVTKRFERHPTSVIWDSVSYPEGTNYVEIDRGLFSENISYILRFEIKQIGKEKPYVIQKVSMAQAYIIEEIPIGTFIVDECKKDHTDMSLRNVKAYSKTVEAAYPQTFTDIVTTSGYTALSYKPSLFYEDIKDIWFPTNLKNSITMRSLTSHFTMQRYSQNYMDIIAKFENVIEPRFNVSQYAIDIKDDLFIEQNNLVLNSITIHRTNSLSYLTFTYSKGIDTAKFYLSNFLDYFISSGGKSLKQFAEETSDIYIISELGFKKFGSGNKLIILDPSTTKKIIIEGYGENLRGRLGIIKCGEPDSFRNYLLQNEQFKQYYYSITQDNLIVDEFANNGKIINNIFDYIRPYANVDIGYGVTKIASEEQVFTLPTEYRTIDLYSTEESVFYIPKKNIYKDRSDFGYFAQPIYTYKLTSRGYISEYSGPFEPPVIWTPRRFTVLDNEGNTLLDILAPRTIVTNISYGMREQSQEGTEFLLLNGGNRYTRTIVASPNSIFESYINPTMFKLPESIENLEATLELQGKFGKMGRDGFLKEYSFGSNINYPNPDLFPSENIYPGSYDENVDSFLYTMKDYFSFWYEDELSKLYGSVSCEYTNIDGNRYTMTVFIEDRDGSDDYQNYDISDNSIIKNNKYTSEEIKEILENLGNAIKNIQYMPMQLECKGFPQIEAGDMAIILTPTETVSSYILRRTLSGINYLTDSIESN